MKYGSSIGKKFYEDGSIRHYPGNTVVADVTPGCGAYDVMCHLRQMTIDAGFDSSFILMPEDSYHMTVIRGLNDQVRTDTHWPAKLPKDLPMEKVDDYIASAIASVGLPGPIRMKFDKVHIGANCCIVHLLPADEAQNKILWDFRNRAAETIGLYLPKHDEYRFHITLAYTRIVPEGAEAERLAALKEEMDAYIAHQPAFETTAPYMAFYDDMLAFSPVRLPR